MLNCRAGRSTGPCASSPRTRPSSGSRNWPSNATGDITAVRAAASSMASGDPPSSRLISTTADSAGTVPRAWSPPTPRQRSWNSWTAGPPGSTFNPVNGTTRSSVSPSRLRLVTSTARSGMAAWIWLTRVAPPVRCSNVSSTSTSGSLAISAARPAQTAVTVCAPDAIGPDNTEWVPAVQARKSAPATPERSRSANGTKTTRRDCRRATSIATLVLPMPPGPVIVTRRQSSSSRPTRCTSVSRPIRGVRGSGRPCRSAVSTGWTMDG